jgi:hypothetical protein
MKYILLILLGVVYFSVYISSVYDCGITNDEAKEENISRQYTMKVIEELKAKGDVYEPTPGVRIKPT